MGGNALTQVKTERIDKDQYSMAVAEVKSWVTWLTDGQCTDILAYAEKDTFGDIDILYTDSNDGKYLYQEIESSSRFPQVVRNGSITSIPWVISYPLQDEPRYVQVDLIRVPDDVFDFSFYYFAYNDLGNLIGKVAHAAGFKFGMNGLEYVVRDGNYKVAEISVTKTFSEAMKFLDYETYFVTEFNNLESVFQFVTSSQFFPYSSYALSKLSNKDRVRDRKRKTYNAFLDWLSTNNIKTDRLDDRSEYRQTMLERAFIMFPHFKVEYDAAQKANEERKIIKEKFNGEIVSSITGLTDKALGRFIQKIRETPNFRQFVLTHSNDEVVKFIESFI